jgi:hypothetical protein
MTIAKIKAHQITTLPRDPSIPKTPRGTERLSDEVKSNDNECVDREVIPTMIITIRGTAKEYLLSSHH